MIVGLVDGCAACENLAAMDRQQTEFARAVVEPFVQEHLAIHARAAEMAGRGQAAISDVSPADAASAGSRAISDLSHAEVWRYRRVRRDGPWIYPVRHASLGLTKGFAGTDYVPTRCGAQFVLGGPAHAAGTFVTFSPLRPEDRQSRPCQRCYGRRLRVVTGS